jgi:flagellin-specific chaperone FliS
MLLALYDAALLKLELAERALDEGNSVTGRQRSLEALRIVAQLNAGIASKYGELSENLKKLCDYASQRILIGDPDGLNDARQVLQRLQEGFTEIRDEAAGLEMQGVIPPLDEIQSCNRTA